MRRITSDVESQILKMLLEGYTYREIAREQDVTISTVNRFVEDERIRTPDFDEIRRVTFKLKKLKITLYDAKRATTLSEKLNKLGIPLQELETYINLIKRILSEQNTNDSLLTSATKLAKIESDTGKSPQKIIEDLENALKRTSKLKKQQAKSLRARQESESEKKKAEIELNRLKTEIQETLTTLSGIKTIGAKKLGHLVKFIQYYEALGFTPQEVKKLSIWQQKLKELGIEPDKLGQWIAERGSLENQNKLTKLENKQLSAANKTLIQANNAFKAISQILTTNKIPIPCKGCGTALSTPLKSREELSRMLEENLVITIICPVCGLTQQLTAWTYLYQLGMQVAPQDNFLTITIDQP